MAEKPILIKPQQQSPDQREAVEESEYYWEKHPVVTNYFPYWKEYIAWFYGNQYTWANMDSGILEDISKKVDREYKNVYNRILPMIRQLWGEILYLHTFYVEPNTSQSKDVKAGKLGSRAIEYTNLNGKFLFKLNHYAKLWALVTGNVYWKEFWNKHLEGKIDDGKGGVTTQPGDVDFNYVNPFLVRADPYAIERKNQRWVIEGQELPKTSVERMFNLSPDSLPADRLKVEDVDLLAMGHKKPEKEETVILMRRYWRPMDKWEKGRYMVTAAGCILYDNASPVPDADLPIIQIPGILPILNQQYYDSPVRIAQQSQRQLNRFGSIIDSHIENYRLKGMIPRGSLDPEEFERYVRADVEYVIYNPTGGGNPYWQQPPALPEIIMRWLMFMENEIETETSVRKVSYGQLPKYAQRASGVLFERMKGQDVSVLVPTVDAIDDAMKDAMTIRLKLMQKHYKEPGRLIRTTGRSRQTVEIFLKDTDLENNTDVRVQSGVDFFSQRQERKEAIVSLAKEGYIAMDEALEAMEYKGLEELTEEKFIDRRYAYRIIDLIREGKPAPEVSEDDNHQVHYDIYNTERKKEEFELWGEDAKAKLMTRIAEHKKYIPTIGEEPIEEGEVPPEETTAAAPAEIAPTAEELIAAMALGPETEAGGY